VFSEFSLQDPRAWDIIRPILAENKGWALFIYTPRGKNHGWNLKQLAEKYPGRWFLSFLTVHDTKRTDGSPVISKEDIQKEREDESDNRGAAARRRVGHLLIPPNR